ncbi:MAG: hypothetical protein MJB57_07765 [Gemmatimonadetes bacterium]|nr:hypothetical protein [Gemmatimonadota bacterium]
MSIRRWVVFAGVMAWVTPPAHGQEPDSLPDPNAGGNCTLTWASLTPETFGTAVRDGPTAHTTYVSGRMLWTCGTATMEADSAVKYDRLRRVDLIGNVSYQDSIRTLRSRLLTYFEIDDLVVADDDVVLVRLVDGSRLTGPHVEFLRAVTGVDEQTTATGRPHMTFYPESEDDAESQEPFEIDADRAHFAGEDEARFHGDVVLERSDIRAEADSAYLTRHDGVGVMWGDPWFEAEEVRLEGDTIRFRSEDEELREVHAEGSGFASGEQFEIRSELIDIALEAEEIEEVWSHGEGISEALSGAHLLYGDSLRFVMRRSEIDTVYAVGDAVGIQGDSTAAADGLRGVPTPDPSAAPNPIDPTAMGPESDSTIVEGDDAASDTAGVAPPATEPIAPGDPVEGPPGGEPAALIESVLASVEVPDSSVALGRPGIERDDDPSPGSDASGHAGPPLSVDGDTNWARGDTLIAVFERPEEIGADSLATGDPSMPGAELPVESDTLVAVAGTTVAGPENPPIVSAAASTEPAREADDIPLPPVGELVDVTPNATPAADSTSDPIMEIMTALGNASAFFRQVRDSSATERPSRGYMIGDTIHLFFEEGEPANVRGINAIGIYLEPEEAVEGASPVDPAASAEALSAPGDRIEPAADTTGTPPDTAAARPDSTGAVRDTTRSGDTVSVARTRDAPPQGPVTVDPEPERPRRTGRRHERLTVGRGRR